MTATTVGQAFATGDLVVVGWLRFESADDLAAGARYLEQISGRDPDAVEQPDEWRRYMVVTYTLDQLREASEEAADHVLRDRKLIEQEGGTWALAYGLGVAYIGALAQLVNGHADVKPCDVAGVRVQAADARFAATVQESVRDKTPPDHVTADGSPFAEHGPGEQS